MLWPESLHLSKGLFNVLKFRAESLGQGEDTAHTGFSITSELR